MVVTPSYRIFIMGIPILAGRHLYIKSAPCSCSCRRWHFFGEQSQRNTIFVTFGSIFITFGIIHPRYTWNIFLCYMTLCFVFNCTIFWGVHVGFIFGISLVAARLQLSLSTQQKTKHNGTAKCKHSTKFYTQGFTTMFHKAVHPKQTYTLCQTWRRNILPKHTLFGVDVTNSVNSFSCKIADPALGHPL